MLRCGIISWQSKLQPTVAGWTCTAEYQAENLAGKEALGLHKLTRNLGHPITGPANVYGDNTSAIALLTITT